MYILKILSDKEFDSLPYKRAKSSYGAADARTKVAYVRKTGIDAFDLGTIQHELDELVAKVSPHEIDGIRYKDKQPEYNPPPPPKVKTAADIFAESTAFGKANYPLAYGAREGAIADINRGLPYYESFQDPQMAALYKQLALGGAPATNYYQGFQPTSFEQALANQYFQNVWPDTEREALQKLSMTGMEYSPNTAATLGKLKGGLETDIGKYLSDIGQQRATTGINALQNLQQTGEQRAINSLNARLGIDPYSTYSPYAETDVSQSNKQAEYEYQYAVQKAQADYQNALAKAKQKASMIKGISSLGGVGLGAGLGALFAAPTGGMSLLAGAGWGALAGGAGANLFSPIWGGGGEGGISFQDALSLTNQFSGMGKAQPVNFESALAKPPKMPTLTNRFSNYQNYLYN